MTSKSFNLGDGGTTGSGSCAKIGIFCCCMLFVVVVIVVGIYAYKSGYGGFGGCGIPVLDENGLSNWTSGAETIAFACFPGYFLEGHSNVLVSTCLNGNWTPFPPACNYLPLRLDCEVNHKGLVGNVTMWQKRASDPTFIYGLVDYEVVDRTDGHLRTIVPISKSRCTVSDDTNNVTDAYPEPSRFSLKIQFNNNQLKAYNKAELHINLIFVDKNTNSNDSKNTYSLVSIHQDDLTIVMNNSIPLSKRAAFGNDF